MGYKLTMFLGLTGLLMVLMVDQADAIRQKRMVEASIDSLMYLSKDPTVLPIEEDEVTFAPTASGEEGEGGHEHASGEEHYAGDGHGHGSSVEHNEGDGQDSLLRELEELLRQEEEVVEEEDGHDHDSDEEHYAGDGHGHGSSVEDRLLRQNGEDGHEHDSDEEHYAGDGHGHGSSVEDRLLRQNGEDGHEHDSDEEHYAGDGHGHGSSVEDLESRILDEAIGLLELLSEGKRQADGFHNT
ncbi:uncharacterized protein LOC144920498 [Branchiostoma floridae x Branchiostoma belcheri]